MTLQFSLGTTSPETADSACVLVGVYEHGVLSSAAAQVDTAAGGMIKRQVESGDITGKTGVTTLLFAPQGVAAKRVMVIGLGSQKSFDASRFQKVNIEAMRAIGRLPITEAVSYLTEVDVPGHDGAWRMRIAALASDHAAYRYTATFKPRDKASKQPQMETITFASVDDAQAGLDQATALAEGVRFARELANLPPNICNPAYIASQAQDFADRHDKVSCNVLDEVAMEKLGFGSLLAVARGSVNKPRLIVLEYKGGSEGDKPFALVGKGVTFDSGGISLKPGAGMEEMKFDMGGAAGVLGAFVAATKMNLKLNLVCVVPSVENMPDGDSYRPSDVITSLSGLTIEVLNTDAEGRLILCDALTYTAQTFQPQAIVDAATLTGACVVALGKHASAVMSKHDDLADELLAAGEQTLDRAWRLPLWDDYQVQLDS
ncbi:MAG: leucyl aminopeptidase, partial [Pseudomonadota bacterium]|nr:leucyl aminopeptidase [Pseudomonadota bacterium]